MSDVYFLTLIFSCLVFSAFFSGSETALLKLNTRELTKALKVHPSISLQAAKELNQSTSRLLVTILLGNNVVNIFGTAAASSLAVAHFGEERGLVVATSAMTILVLIFSEILPKTIAANNSFMVTKIVALPLYALHKLLTPIHWVFEKSINPLIRQFQAHDHGEEGPSSYEDLMMLAREVKPHPKKRGVTPLNVIGATAKSSEIVLEEIMVNRAAIKSCSIKNTTEDALEILLADRYTRLPVYDGSIDNIIGIVHLKDLVLNQKSQSSSLKEIIRPVISFSERTKLFNALATMQTKCSQMAIVKDEFGTTQGLVTLEDILEELVGEIRDEFDEEELSEIVKIGDGEYRVDSTLLVSDVIKRTGIMLEAEKRDTLGGLLFNKLDGQVLVGSKISGPSYLVEVTKVDRNMIQEVIIRKTET
ncbi:MAG: hemolysin family protein [Bacteriovoracaceae bacterium]|nr:hemolysin family protein [Bacteriovoracaceae bacterium]